MPDFKLSSRIRHSLFPAFSEFAYHYSWLLACASVLFLDQLTKWIVRETLPQGSVVEVLPFFSLVHSVNTGAGFSILTGQNLVLSLVALAALVGVSFIIPSLEPEKKLLAGLFLGGICGNLVDRLLSGGVTDFLLLHWQDFSWPAFNVADSALTISVLLLLISEFSDRK